MGFRESHLSEGAQPRSPPVALGSDLHPGALSSAPSGEPRRSPAERGHETSSKPARKRGVMIYWVEFVDHGNNVRGVERIEHATDAEAIEAAHEMNILTFIAGFDVWEHDRLVHRYRKYQQSPP